MGLLQCVHQISKDATRMRKVSGTVKLLIQRFESHNQMIKVSEYRVKQSEASLGKVRIHAPHHNYRWHKHKIRKERNDVEELISNPSSFPFAISKGSAR